MATTVWRLITHHENQPELLKKSIMEGRIALGWSFIGDAYGYDSPPEISAAVKRLCPGLKNWHYSGKCVWRFTRDMKVGDLVILSADRARQCVMRVTGEYRFVPVDDESMDYSHRRAAELTRLDANEVWKSAGGMAPGQNVYQTLIQCTSQI